mmetsp:Transcript_7866/g.24125  ORF Transcript_7866/g.24125 Transcript_7866/m.24125 type:complete len:92 (-) Transcript_7866:1188-1463(-)
MRALRSVNSLNGDCQSATEPRREKTERGALCVRRLNVARHCACLVPSPKHAAATGCYLRLRNFVGFFAAVPKLPQLRKAGAIWSNVSKANT